MSQELCNGMENAPQRALYKALGLTDNELGKPIIAVITAQSHTSPELECLERVTEAVKAGIYAGGCTPIVAPITAVGGGAVGVNGKYSLPSREIIADSVETLLDGDTYAGAVFVANGDETIPGMLMGAARVNIPSVFVSGGPTASGKLKGKKVGLPSLFEAIGQVKKGAMNIDDLTALESYACSGCGGTIGVFDCLLEALGMALPGNGTALSGTGERLRIAKNTGLKICELVGDAVAIKKIMTKRAFVNALALNSAIGSSTNAVLHLIAIAAECGVAIDSKLVQTTTDTTPTLVRLLPLGEYDMYDFNRAGGVMAVLHELAKKNLIDGSLHTVAGESLATFYDHAHVLDTEVIHKADDPISPIGGIAVISGNLAENGALASRTAIDKNLKNFSGKAKCFNREEEAVEAIYSGKIKSGDVVVIRYEGPIGGPGMRELISATSALVGMGLEKSVALITDGRLPDSARGAVVGQICPEAADGGKLALVKDGDIIKVDIQGGRLTLDVPAKELQARQKKSRPKDSTSTGWLLRYQNLVTPATNGAVLKKKF